MTEKEIVTYSAVYSDVNKNKPASYYDYENSQYETGSADQFSIISRIGHGKYSDVFLGKLDQSDEDVVIKALKPVRGSKVNREILILKNLRNGVNIVNLLQVTKVDETKMISLVFEYKGSQNLKQIVSQLTRYDIKFYAYELLKALDFCHSMGIMHRDVKPLNLVVNHETKELRLIDWGLAEFYHAGQRYNVCVASRHYKGPELLVPYHYYDYSLDMWCFACTLGFMMFRLSAMFCGCDNTDQLLKIVSVLGSAKFYKYVAKYSLTLDEDFKDAIKRKKAKKLEKFINDTNSHLVDPLSLDLMNQLLLYDHQERLTAAQAMEHPLFYEVRRNQTNSNRNFSINNHQPNNNF